MNVKNYLSIGCLAFLLLYFYLLITHFETTFLVTLCLGLALYVFRKQLIVLTQKLTMKIVMHKMNKMASGMGAGSDMSDMMNMFNQMRDQMGGAAASNTGSNGTMPLHDTTRFLAARGFNAVEKKDEGTDHPSVTFASNRHDYKIRVTLDIQGFNTITYTLTGEPSGKAPFADLVTDSEDDLINELRNAMK